MTDDTDDATPSRRSLREAERSGAHAVPRRSRRRPRRRGRRGMWITLSVLSSLVIVIVAGGIALVHVFGRAVSVGDKLTDAVPLIQTVQEDILALDSEKAAADAATLTALTGEARAETDDVVWSALEHVPGVGENLRAIRAASEVADDVATGVVQPFAGISLSALTPTDGRIDLAALDGFVAALDGAETVIDASETRMSAIDTDGLLLPVSVAVSQLQPRLTEARGVVDDFAPVLRILPDTLGASGPRNYLVLFQNNAEAQALGGGTASLMLLTVDDGTVTLGQQESSQSFPRVLTPGVDVDPSAIALFGDNMSFDLNTSTSRPDFPTAASIATQFWERFNPQTIDGVLAVDPVALSYLLVGTGPIPLESGDVLTSQNAVQLLLSDVYARFVDRPVFEQDDLADAFFEDASARVFTTVMSGSSDVATLIPAITTSVEENRILAWSSDPAEQELLAGTPIAGILPTTDAEETLTGVFYRDSSVGSKLDYYLDTSVTSTATDRCSGTGATFTTSTTLTSTLDRATALTLPLYVTGITMPQRGDSTTEVYIYGPVGSTFRSVAFDGEAPGSVVRGGTDDLGRPVAHVSVFLEPGQSVSATAVFDGIDGADQGPATVRTTPMLRATDVTVKDTLCE